MRALLFLTLAAFASSGFAANSILPLSEGWVNIGPFGGPAGYISVDQQNPERLIASSKTGNVFISENGGGHWTRLPFPRIPGAAIGTLKIHPKNPELFFAGVSDETGDYSGLYESTDSGKTWTRAKEMKDAGVFALAFFNPDPSIVAAGTRLGVFISRDSGKTWHKDLEEGGAGPSPVMSLAFDPKDHNTVYAGTTHLPWKTVDGGKTWKSIHNGMIDDSDVFSFHVDSKNPDRVYASACSGIYASEKRGEQWRKAQGIPGTDRRTHVVTEDPFFSQLIYAGTTAGLWKSADAGNSWRKLNNYLIRSVEFHPRDGRVVYMATQDHGLMKSMTAALEFQEINNGFVGRPIIRLLSYGTKGLTVVALKTNGAAGLFRSDDLGRKWTEVEIDMPSVTDAAYLKNSLYIKTPKGIYREGKKGTWTKVELPGDAEANMMDAGSSLWVTTKKGLLRSADGVRWIPVQSPDRSAIYDVYLGEKNLAVRTGKGLWFSSNQGGHWTSITPPSDGQLFQLALHPSDSRILFAATSSGLMKSNDQGRTWTQVGGGLPLGFMYSVVANPVRRQEWFTAQLGKVFRSTDDGQTWQALEGAAIDSALIKRLHVSGMQPDMIFALTESQGLYARKFLP